MASSICFNLGSCSMAIRHSRSKRFLDDISFLHSSARGLGTSCDLVYREVRIMDTERGNTSLPNGCTLYWEKNEVGGRVYASDEIGGGVTVWDTALVDFSTLLAAIVQEERLRVYEHHKEMGHPLPT